jgi:hypothetical protein
VSGAIRTLGLDTRTESVSQLSHEETDVGDDAEGLVTAPVGQLGDHRLVDVDAVGLHAGGEEIAGGDGVEGGGEHESDVDIVEKGTHGVGGRHHVGDHVGKGSVVTHGAAQA